MAIKIDHNGDNPRQIFRVFEGADFPFPSHAECWHCEGTGGTDTRPRSGGDRMEPDDYYWGGCDYCEDGVIYSATAKAIKRYVIRPIRQQAAA